MLYLAARNQKNSFHLCLVEAETAEEARKEAAIKFAGYLEDPKYIFPEVCSAEGGGTIDVYYPESEE